MKKIHKKKKGDETLKPNSVIICEYADDIRKKGHKICNGDFISYSIHDDLCRAPYKEAFIKEVGVYVRICPYSERIRELFCPHYDYI